MGFYLRKSISVGPLRFNLSKSGVGVSAGFKGFRVGMGPRGNYVHMGRGGLYYRATIPSASPTYRSGAMANAQSALPNATPPEASVGPMVGIESGCVTKMVDSSSAQLLEELNGKRKLLRSWPWVLVIALSGALYAMRAAWPEWALASLIVVGALGTIAASVYDRLRKSVVVFYEMEPQIEAAFGEFHAAATALAGTKRVWHKLAAARVRDSKYHAGADHLIERRQTSVRRAEPPYVKTNVETVAIGVGRQTLHFFPDRVLVFDSNGVGAVGYDTLRIAVGTTSFIEEEGVPSDAKVVDKTWKYVNKRGGPDKRFKENRELPVCQYETMHFSSDSGLNEQIMLSHCGAGAPFGAAIAKLGAVLARQPAAQPEARKHNRASASA